MSRTTLIRLTVVASALTTALASPASAHIGGGDTHDLVDGVMHPFGGPDHVLAMVGVGLLAASLGGRALWRVPAAFLLMMIAGSVLGMSRIDIPFVEAGIAASVAVLGLAIAVRLPLPTLAATALVGFFAIFHGHSHGAEISSDLSGAGFALGFVMATAMLHVAGIGIGVAVDNMGGAPARWVTRANGAALTLAGLVLVAGSL